MLKKKNEDNYLCQTYLLWNSSSSKCWVKLPSSRPQWLLHRYVHKDDDKNKTFDVKLSRAHSFRTRTVSGFWNNPFDSLGLNKVYSYNIIVRLKPPTVV